jgi:hypothetical protein
MKFLPLSAHKRTGQPQNRVLGHQGRGAEKAAAERDLHRSPHKLASRAGRGVFSRFSGESEILSACET